MKRDQRRRPVGRPPKIDWSRWDRMLGTIPDTHLAGLIGCTRANIVRRRKRLGIRAYQPRWGTPPAAVPHVQADQL